MHSLDFRGGREGNAREGGLDRPGGRPGSHRDRGSPNGRHYHARDCARLCDKFVGCQVLNKHPSIMAGRADIPSMKTESCFVFVPTAAVASARTIAAGWIQRAGSINHT